MNKKLYIVWLAAAGVAILIVKTWFAQATNSSCYLLLAPTTTLIEWVTGHDFVSQGSQGFYNSELAVRIDKSCSGVNFLLISYALAVFSLFKPNQIFKRQALLFLSLPLLSYLLTLMANTSRISGAIAMLKLKTQLTWLAAPEWHQIEGVLVYLTFLTAFYFLLIKIAKHNSPYEKLDPSFLDPNN